MPRGIKAPAGCRREDNIKTYDSWRAARKRCNSSYHHNYADYGGRGIEVCERWNSYDKFFEDVGPRPDGMTLDRIDPNGNYEPSNCKWSTHKEQRANQRPRKPKATA